MKNELDSTRDFTEFFLVTCYVFISDLILIFFGLVLLKDALVFLSVLCINGL
jgi:hypothetical protein